MIVQLSKGNIGKVENEQGKRFTKLHCRVAH